MGGEGEGWGVHGKLGGGSVGVGVGAGWPPAERRRAACARVRAQQALASAAGRMTSRGDAAHRRLQLAGHHCPPGCS